MSIVSQDPVPLNAAIGENIDPLSLRSDSVLWNAVNQGHMREVVERGDVKGNGDGVGLIVCDAGVYYSSGER